MKNKQSDSISQTVMSQIKEGKVTIKPRAYFSLLAISSAIIIILSGVITSYLSSIIFYWIRIETSNRIAYGARANLNELIESFPWWALIFAITLFVFAIVLVHRHGKMYRHKSSTIAIILVTISLCIGLSLSLLGLGDTHNNRPAGRGQGQNLQRNR